MKLIIDFDDTLSNNSLLKERTFECLEEVGVSEEESKQYYKEVRASRKPFSLKQFLLSIFARAGIKKETEDIYEKIMEICPTLLDKNLLDIVRKLGENNCYMVTNGDLDYQMDKIKRSNITQLFCEIIVVPGSKKEEIEKICINNKDEKIIFIDNKEEFFVDLDMNLCKNLKTILYDKHNSLNIENLMGLK